MLIGLHDADQDHLKHKKYPNLALMKLAAYHKKRGDEVNWWIGPIENHVYDRIYSAKIFDFTPENPDLPDATIKGGTGYDIKSALPPKVDCMAPDYSIYPNCDFAIGFTTRGCPNRCRWCVVPEKEGEIRPYRDWYQIIRPDTDKLILMDNNILASDHGIKQLKDMVGSRFKLDLNQGMDARLVTPAIAEILARLRWIRYIRFSCDQRAQIAPIKRTADLLMGQGVKPSNLFIYMLVTDDLEDAAYRTEQIKKIGPIRIYAQAERNARAGIIPNKDQLDFCQRYIYGGGYRSETWAQYQKRNRRSRR